jgi:hypothetical protein
MLRAIAPRGHAAGPAPLKRRTLRCLACLFSATVLFAELTRASALDVLGQLGVLGEWELNATLREGESNPEKSYSGRLVMRHVGICTQDGPEERAGEMRLHLLASGSRVRASLIFEGVECLYDARKSHAYEGTMTCPGREPLPMMLWLK